MNYHILRILASFLSKRSDKTIDRFASFFTFLMFDVLRMRRGLAIENLKRVFKDQKSEDELTSIARLSVKNFFLTIFEFFRGYGTDITEGVSFKGEDHYLKALERGEGAYIVCCHLGNWEAMGAAISRKLTPTRVVVKRVGAPATDRFVRELRDHNGFTYIERRKKGDGVKGIMQALKSNESIGFVMDQYRPGEPRMDFFGHPARTNTSMAALWRRKRVPVLSSFAKRTGVSQHLVEFLPEVELKIMDDEETEIMENTKILSKEVEKMILKNPEQYLWIHKRWK